MSLNQLSKPREAFPKGDSHEKFLKMTTALILFGSLAQAAESPSVEWGSRTSKVLCGATVDNESVEIKVVLPNELLRAESTEGRVLAYIDLRKPGRVHLRSPKV